MSAAAWQAERATLVGASEAATALGANPYESAHDLWAAKCGLREPRDVARNLRVRWGEVQEDQIADAYAKLTGRRLIDYGRHALRRHPTAPLGATIDREIVHDGPDGNGVLEIKAVERPWDSVPLIYEIQVQAQMAVTGLRWAEIACHYSTTRDDAGPELFAAIWSALHGDAATTAELCRTAVAKVLDGGTLTIHEIERNDEFIEDILIPTVTRFWRHVEERTPLPEGWPA